jgi:HprK-related kinase A
VIFEGDGERPFEPLADDLAYPMLEWGFNWRVATTAHQFLMLHSAVLERNGVTILMPALPGSGKSTLAAALMLSGWRLLSDEFGLIRPGTDAFVPFPRPIPLKNESIEVVRAFSCDAVLGTTFHGTRKGDIAHCRPTERSVRQAGDEASVTHLIFPRFESGAATTERSFPRAKAFMKLCGNSFNYDVLGIDGFETIGRIVEKSECLSFVYGDLEDAIGWFDRLAVST